MAFGSPLYNIWLQFLGSHVSADALLFAAVSDFDVVTIGSGTVVDKEAVISGTRLLPAKGGPFDFSTCFGQVRLGPRSTVSHSAAVVAAETAELSVLAPLSTPVPSMKLLARTFAVGAPPQKFVWSRDQDSLAKPSSRPAPRDLRPEVSLPPYV